MKLSVGKVAFPIEFDNGKKGCIFFNPNDPELATRMINARDKIAKRLDGINAEDVNLDPNGNVELPQNLDGFDELTDEQKEALLKRAESHAALIDKTQKILREEIDEAFNSEISDEVFKYCSPLGLVNGEYFVIQFFNAIAPEIQKHVTKATAEAEKKMAKHTAKYQKK